MLASFRGAWVTRGPCARYWASAYCTRFGRASPALLCFATVALVAKRSGGWFPTTWGWAALALLFVTAAAVILVPALEGGGLDLAFVGGLAALTAWIGLSAIWSESRPQSMLELERALVYCGGVLALLVVARRRTLGSALAGLLAASVALCVHALATRLAPDHVHWAGSSLGFRLAGVFRYPNALGITAVLGLLLALGLVADARSAPARAAAAAGTVPLALALYLATSRGAWLSLVLGLAAALALAPERRRLARTLLPLAAVCALAVWLLSRSHPLTRWDDPAGAAHDGHRMAIAALALAAAAALTVLPRTRGALAAALVAGALAIAVAPSSPVARVAAGPGAPVVPGAPGEGTTPGDLLFSASSNSRTEYWRVAAIDAVHHPLLGSGAGTFVSEWYRHRRVRVAVQDAHSLYLETLAELGAVGLALLVLVLSVPVRAAVRARREPFVAGTFGAFAAFAIHAAVDWDWELPAVTLAGLFCAALLVVAARPPHASLVLEQRWRGTLLVPVLALLVFAFVGLVGNRAEASALRPRGAATGGRPRRRRRAPAAGRPGLPRRSSCAPTPRRRGDLAGRAPAARRRCGRIRTTTSSGTAWPRSRAATSGGGRTSRRRGLNPLG